VLKKKLKTSPSVVAGIMALDVKAPEGETLVSKQVPISFVALSRISTFSAGDGSPALCCPFCTVGSADDDMLE
jgi:hypothetical protein